MSAHQPESSDTGAAYFGLIGGALFIGIILYGIVFITNNQFKNEKAEGKKAAVTSAVAPIVG